MEQILGLFISLVMDAHQPVECEPLVINHRSYEYTYNVPEGIEVIHDGWKRRRSNLTISDDFGNSFDIYKSGKYILEDRIEYDREWWGDDLLDEDRISDEIMKFYVYNEGPFDAFDSMYLVEKDEFMIRIYGYFQGDPSTHGVFEERALNFVRSIAQGDLRDGTHCNDGFNSNRWTWESVWKSIR